jgi:hypothetical protein
MSKSLVRFTVLGSADCGVDCEEIRLEVGDHSPIWVIKDELERQTGKPRDEQVLCLLNDKGDEGQLLEDERATIYSCGITSGSTLLLSSLTTAPAPARRQSRRSGEVPPPAVGAGPGDVSAASAAAAVGEGAAERARGECRAWCAEMSLGRRRAREQTARAEREAQLGTPIEDAPLSIAPEHGGVQRVLTTLKPPRR